MIRKLFLLAVMAVTAFALSAASASAVTVENPGMYEVTGENTIAIILEPDALPGAKFDITRCNNDWEANIDSSGHVDVHRLDFAGHSGSTPNCGSLNDCGPDNGWEGQIEEGATDQFTVHIVFCLNVAGELQNQPVPVECDVDDANGSVHCDQLIHRTVHPQLGPSSIEVEGELSLGGSLGLMHNET